MCASTPKVESAPPPPLVENLDPNENKSGMDAAAARRRRQILSASKTQGAGALQGAEAGTPAAWTVS